YNGGMKRLVKVFPRYRDPVLESRRNGLPRRVHDSKGGIAVLYRLGDDSNRDEVVDLIYGDLLPFEFVVDREEPLDPAFDVIDLNPAGSQHLKDSLFDVFEKGLQF